MFNDFKSIINYKSERITRIINLISMNKLNNYIKIISLIIFSALFGCENFEDINSNPDTTTEVSSSLLCAKVVLSVTEFNSEDNYRYFLLIFKCGFEKFEPTKHIPI